MDSIFSISASLSESFLNVKSLRVTVPLVATKSLISDSSSHNVWVQLFIGEFEHMVNRKCSSTLVAYLLPLSFDSECVSL